MGIGQRRLRLDAIKLNAESILFTSNIPNASSLLYGRDKKGRCSKVLSFRVVLVFVPRQEAANRGRDDYENKREWLN